MVISSHSETSQQTLDQERSVERQSNGLTDPLVVERRIESVEIDLSVLGGGNAGYVRIGCRQQSGGSRKRDVGYHIEPAFLERGDRGRLVGEEGHLHAAGLRAVVTPVVLVLDVDRPDARVVAVQYPGSRADKALLVASLGVALPERCGEDAGVVVVRTHEERERCIGLAEGELDGVLVQSDDGCGVDAIGLEGRAGIATGDAPDRGDHVIGHHRRAVVIGRRRIQAESPHGPVGIGLPAFRQHGDGGELSVGEDQVLGGLAEHGEASLILDQNGIDAYGRGNHRRPDDGGPGRRGGAGGTRSSGECCHHAAEGGCSSVATAGSSHESQDRNRHSEDGSPPDEVAAGDLPSRVLVDDVVLDRARLPTNCVKTHPIQQAFLSFHLCLLANADMVN